MKHLLAFLLVTTMCLSAQADDYVTLTKTYVYTASPEESPGQAKQNALNRAKTEALRERFGSVVSGASASSLISKNNITKSKFVSLSSEGELNGEWIADIEEPKFSTELDGEKLVVTVTVKGKAREITNNPIDFKATSLRNKPYLDFERTDFSSGDTLYIHFTSPVDGYLTIYLLDDETAYCLLPYAKNKDGIYPIVHGKEYLLLSPDIQSQEEDFDNDSYCVLTTESKYKDLNLLYFIFSPHKFTKAGDTFRKTDDGTIYPRMLSWANFQKWIMHTRSRDKEMSVQTKYIVINPMKD